MSAKKRTPKLGQHFLTNPHYAHMLTESVQVKNGEIILEIGPGRGALTKILLETGANVVTIERDEALASYVESVFSKDVANKKLHVVRDDVRDIDPDQLGLTQGKYVVAANIPYYITGEIIRQFLETNIQPRAIALLVQKEVARRIIAKKESILSLSVKVYGTPKIIATVGRGNFSPPPSVDSAIILIDNISKEKISPIGEEHFFRVVRAGFASKRKKLLSNLSVSFGKEKVTAAFTKRSLSENTRAEDLALETWLDLAKDLH